MEPLHPDLRAALKRAHPNLTDADIDRTEDLLARRMSCDPEREREEIERLDRERLALIERVMPRYGEVTRAFAQARRPPATRPPAFVVTPKNPKKPKDDRSRD